MGASSLSTHRIGALRQITKASRAALSQEEFCFKASRLACYMSAAVLEHSCHAA